MCLSADEQRPKPRIFAIEAIHKHTLHTVSNHTKCPAVVLQVKPIQLLQGYTYLSRQRVRGHDHVQPGQACEAQINTTCSLFDQCLPRGLTLTSRKSKQRSNRELNFRLQARRSTVPVPVAFKAIVITQRIAADLWLSPIILNFASQSRPGLQVDRVQ